MRLTLPGSNTKVCAVKGGSPAISSLVVEILILILTAILVPLVIMWVIGVWQTTEESFSLTPTLHVAQNSTGNPILVLHITNNGKDSDVIIRIAIKAGNGYYINTTMISIPGGFTGSVIVGGWEISGNPQALKPGETYRVYIYTKVHGMLLYDVVAST